MHPIVALPASTCRPDAFYVILLACLSRHARSTLPARQEPNQATRRQGAWCISAIRSTMGRREDKSVGVSDCGVAPQLQRSADIRLLRFLWLRGSAPARLAADALLPRNGFAAEIAHSLWSKTTIARRSGSNVARMIEIRQSGTSGTLRSGVIYASIGRHPVARIKMPA